MAADEGPPAVQPSPSGTDTSLAYSVDTDALHALAGSGAGDDAFRRTHQDGAPQAEFDGGPSGEPEYEYETDGYETGVGGHPGDATATVRAMHRRLLTLLSNPEHFAEAVEWQTMIDRGIDPATASREGAGAGEGGMASFDGEFDDDEASGAADETKEDDKASAEEKAGGEGAATEGKYRDQSRLIPPLPLQIFAPDAEVVLPQALTASQLFGIERLTGIELEAAAGVVGLSQLFLRWLALMPEGDHEQPIDPPGLTVMRISGGRYRVTGAHRVVWRWMNKFSPVSEFGLPGEAEAAGEDGSDGDATDFDFGDLVTMTIVDVFETDSDGRLLSYCPTFDNRAVRRTREGVERLRKGTRQIGDGVRAFANSPAGRTAASAAGGLGKMALMAGSMVRHRIEEEMTRHGNGGVGGGGGGGGTGESEATSDAVGGDDVAEEDEEEGDGPAAGPPAKDGGEAQQQSPGRSSGGHYFSDDSTAASSSRRVMEV